MTSKPTLWLSQHAPRRLVIVGLLALIGLIIGCALIIPTLRLSSGLLLSPPTYPNSWLVLERMGGGTGGMRRTVVTATTDPPNRVVASFNQQLPGFQQTTIFRNGVTITSAYRNYQCNDTPLTVWFRRYFSNRRSNYCISVIVYPDTDSQNGTLMETEVSPVATPPNP